MVMVVVFLFLLIVFTMLVLKLTGNDLENVKQHAGLFFAKF
jgi:hypothetical protein